MTFDEVLDQVRELLQSKGRLAYGALKRRFDLDDRYLEDLKAELIDAEQVARDEDGKVLVWTSKGTEEESENRRIGESGEKQTPPSDARLSTLDSRRDAGERRQLTVQFIDLVGSTALSQQLDPEDYHTRVVAYQAVCHQVIARYEGHIAQYLGDGVLVYFGYPQAHEDDAARAVRSGLEIIEALQRQVPSPFQGEGQGEGSVAEPPPDSPHPSPLPQGARGLQVRIGIHTGPVVVGEIGAGERTERLALGETPNIAARVQGQAEPDNVVMSAATYRLVQGLFECYDLGPQVLKGLSTPFSLYRVVSEGAVQSRFEAAMQTGLTPLVGREEELGLLQHRWEQARVGDGQVVLLSGEPGIGKSRLVQELKEHVSAEGTTRIEFRCSPYHQNSALYPIIDHLQRFLQFEREDAPAVKLEKLQHTLSHYRFPQADTAPLLAALLSLPHPAGYPPITVSPQKQKEKTHAALMAWLVEETEEAAVYCAWEDLHWADPSTLEVLALLLDQAPTTRLLALLTFRPEFMPSWGNRSHLSQMTLSRLGSSQVEAMVERVAGGKALPHDIVQQIVSKTDGVPLFIEELTKTVMETIREQATGNGEQEGKIVETPSGLSSLQLSIPATLQDALMARLDRLGPSKEIVQLGATLGREFSYELLQAVASLDEATLQHGLKQLVEVELIYQRGLPPQATYLFKHALIQDTAYQSLLKSKRQQLHRHIAQVLEEQFPETKEMQPELVAHHYTEAGLIEQSLPHWQKAGERATQRSANMEAISHLTKALELLKTLPDTPERPERELDLQTALGQAMMVTKGWATREVEHIYARARELCRQVGETPHLFSVLWGLWAVFLMRNQLETARELAEQLVRMAQRIQDSALLVAAYFMLGDTLFALGDFVPSQENFEQGIALYDPLAHRAFAFRYGQDPGVTCIAQGAIGLWYLGYPEQSLAWAHKALALTQEPSHPFSSAYSLDMVAVVYQLRNEARMVQEQAEAAIPLSREHEFPFWLAFSTILRGWGLSQQGQPEEGIAQIREGLAAWKTEGSELLRPYALALLAEVYGQAGRREEGLTVLAEALSLGGRKAEQHYVRAELYRLKGTLTLQLQVESHKSKVKEQEAEECFLKAITIAKKQQAKSLELRAVMSLSRLWRQQGKYHAARDMLSEIYGWFTEGFDTKDLQEAKALLEELIR